MAERFISFSVVSAAFLVVMVEFSWHTKFKMYDSQSAGCAVAIDALIDASNDLVVLRTFVDVLNVVEIAADRLPATRILGSDVSISVETVADNRRVDLMFGIPAKSSAPIPAPKPLSALNKGIDVEVVAWISGIIARSITASTTDVERAVERDASRYLIAEVQRSGSDVVRLVETSADTDLVVCMFAAAVERIAETDPSNNRMNEIQRSTEFVVISLDTVAAKGLIIFIFAEEDIIEIFTWPIIGRRIEMSIPDDTDVSALIDTVKFLIYEVHRSGSVVEITAGTVAEKDLDTKRSAA